RAPAGPGRLPAPAPRHRLGRRRDRPLHLRQRRPVRLHPPDLRGVPHLRLEGVRRLRAREPRARGGLPTRRGRRGSRRARAQGDAPGVAGLLRREDVARQAGVRPGAARRVRGGVPGDPRVLPGGGARHRPRSARRGARPRPRPLHRYPDARGHLAVALRADLRRGRVTPAPVSRAEPLPRGTVAATARALGRAPCFASLPEGELRRLAARCRGRSLTPGETVFEEGQPCRGLLVVAEGRVEIRQMSLRGREQVFHAEGPGAALGEGPLFDGGGYIASAVAVAPTRVLLLPRGLVIELCRRRPDVALAMLKTLARRVRHFAGIVGDLAFRPVARRLARYLEPPPAAQGRPPLR